MTLQTSGNISLTDLQGEFGGTPPLNLTDYYAGGGLVPAGATDGSGNPIPSSGTIKLTDFYGASNITISLSDHSITDVGQSYAESGFSLTNSGEATGYALTSNNNYSYSPEWASDQPNTAGADYECRATLQSGTISGTMDTWLLLSTTRQWIVTASASSGQINNNSGSFLLEIRDASTQIVLTSATISLSALADNS